MGIFKSKHCDNFHITGRQKEKDKPMGGGDGGVVVTIQPSG